MKKTYSKTGRTCRVTFELAGAGEAQKIALLGDFNEWNPGAHFLKRRKDGTYAVTVSLEAGQEYRYRFLKDGQTWLNDPEADKRVANPFGTEDSVVVV